MPVVVAGHSALELGIDAGSYLVAPAPVPPAGSADDLEMELELLRLVYGFQAASSVEAVLRELPRVRGLLMEAFVPVRQVFGVDAQVVLTTASEPDIAAPVRLFAEIQTPLPIDDALSALDRFDTEWFLGRLPAAGDRFNFNLKFV